MLKNSFKTFKNQKLLAGAADAAYKVPTFMNFFSQRRYRSIKQGDRMRRKLNIYNFYDIKQIYRKHEETIECVFADAKEKLGIDE